MAREKLIEGQTRRTPLPCPPVGEVEMVEQMQFGMHSIAIEKMGIQAAKVYVRDYPHWDSAFNAVMDKAGV